MTWALEVFAEQALSDNFRHRIIELQVEVRIER